MGLLSDDREYIDAITEASMWGSGTFLRRMFAILMLSSKLSRPEVVWNTTSPNLVDDILHIQRRLLGAQGKHYHIFPSNS